MAELLVQAKPHWIDTLTQSEKDNLPGFVKRTMNARSQIGDIIVIQPDGWVWGREERLPNYIVVKIPGVPVEDVKFLVRKLYGGFEPNGKRIVLRKRKHKIPSIFMNRNKNKDVVEVDSTKITQFINDIETKTS